MSDSVWPHRRQPTRLLCPWDSPGKNTGVGCHFSKAWKWKVKVKSLSRVWLFATPWTAAHQAPPSMGFSRQEYWSGVPLPSPQCPLRDLEGKQKPVCSWSTETGDLHISPAVWSPGCLVSPLETLISESLGNTHLSIQWFSGWSPEVSPCFFGATEGCSRMRGKDWTAETQVLVTHYSTYPTLHYEVLYMHHSL